MLRAALTLLTASLAGVADAARPPLCPAGRYVVPATGSVLVVGDGRLTLGAYDSIRLKRRTSRRGTRLRARLAETASAGAVSSPPTTLVARIVDGCTRIEGTVKTGRARPVPFSAALSACGDGVLDSGAGEQCDGVPTCADGGFCAACRCLPPGVTTTTTSSTTAPTTLPGSTMPGSTTTTTPPPPLPFDGLPADIRGFQRWLRLNASPIPADPPDDPHDGTKNVYVNQPRELIAPGGQQVFPFPDGTIVVKTSARPNGQIRLVAIMRKRAGGDPLHGDWEFIEYTRSGSQFSGSVCWECHVSADDRDWVFTRLE